MTGQELRAKAYTEALPHRDLKGALRPGYWCISEEAWATFQTGGLDPEAYQRGALPTLLGRPLMRRPDPDPDHLHYEPAR